MASNMKESLFVRIRRWYTDGGVLKMIGRTFLLIGIIIALAFASVGYVNMLNTRNADQAAKYEENVKKAQDRAYKQLVKDAKKAEKNGEVPPEVPEDASMIEVEVKPVVLDLGNYVGDYITTYVFWAIISLAAGVALYWFFTNIEGIIHALITMERRRLIAGIIFWLSALVAAVIAGFGVVKIMSITKSTLAEVGTILLQEYIVWSVAVFGSGIAIRWLILNLGGATEGTFQHVGMKLTRIGKALFVLAVILFPFGLVGAVMLGILYGWVPAVICLVADCTVLVCGWICGLALNALGTCTMIMEPQAKEAQDRELRRRNAREWVCPGCGKVQPINVAVCDCGEVKPEHYHI